jgi:hypothetical protein
VLLGERPEHRRRVVADRKHGDGLLGQTGQDSLQLDELRLAERSPVGAAVEDDERPALPAALVEVDGLPELVGQAHVRESLSLARADRREVPRR